MHVSVYLEAESPCQFPVFQTTHFGALVRLLFHELLGLQLRRLLRWSSIGAREGFYLLCSLLLEPWIKKIIYGVKFIWISIGNLDPTIIFVILEWLLLVYWSRSISLVFLRGSPLDRRNSYRH